MQNILIPCVNEIIRFEFSRYLLGKTNKVIIIYRYYNYSIIRKNIHKVKETVVKLYEVFKEMVKHIEEIMCKKTELDRIALQVKNVNRVFKDVNQSKEILNNCINITLINNFILSLMRHRL